MTLRTIRLVERRGSKVRLPNEDVRFLLTHASHLIEVVPAFRRGWYRLTPRAFVGWFDGPTCRFAIHPKVPWPCVRMLLGLPSREHASSGSIEPEEGLADALARELSEQLRAIARQGLVAGYHDREGTATFLRGRLRVAEQLRDAAARAFPDRFHLTESVLDLKTAWNQIPRTIAAQLLALPELSEMTRIELQDAIRPLDGLPIVELTESDFVTAETEPRTAHYLSLLALCRKLHQGFTAARLRDSGTGAFLIDLGRTFERYLSEGLAQALGGRSGWSVEAQARFPIGAVLLQPDLVIRRGNDAHFVLDAKWKLPRPSPDAADLHQVLAYASITGARHVGLAYPGRRFSRRTFTIPGSDVHVSLLRVQVIGTDRECGASLVRLVRFVRSRKL